jgi:hypothetical protein
MTPTRPDFTTRTFWINTLERIVRTGAQTALALGITDAATALHVDWQQGAITVVLAMGASLLMALAGRAVGDSDSPSFVLPAPPRHRRSGPARLTDLGPDTREVR